LVTIATLFIVISEMLRSKIPGHGCGYKKYPNTLNLNTENTAHSKFRGVANVTVEMKY